jgi:integrase
MMSAIVASRNPNHPKKGASIKVEPIRDKKAIQRIKKLLRDDPRDLCLFVVGINTAFRANELLSLQVEHVRYLQPGDVLQRKQSKTQKYRGVILNRSAHAAIQTWLASQHGQCLSDTDFLFTGKRGVLTVPTVSTMVKTWCRNVGLKGNYGSHTLRKTWGYWQRKERGTAIPLLMEAFRHTTQRQTLEYLCIEADEIAEIYSLEL